MFENETSVFWTPTQIAERDQVSRQSVSKSLKKLIADHKLEIKRDHRGRVSHVSIAHYDLLRGQFSNPAKTNQKQSGLNLEPIAQADSFDEARRQKEWIAVDRANIQRREELRSLVRADILVDALEYCGRDIAKIIDRLPNKADDLALAVSKDGAHGLRVALKNLSAEMRTEIATSFDKLIPETPIQDAVSAGKE